MFGPLYGTSYEAVEFYGGFLLSRIASPFQKFSQEVLQKHPSAYNFKLTCTLKDEGCFVILEVDK